MVRAGSRPVGGPVGDAAGPEAGAWESSHGGGLTAASSAA